MNRDFLHYADGNFIAVRWKDQGPDLSLQLAGRMGATLQAQSRVRAGVGTSLVCEGNKRFDQQMDRVLQEFELAMHVVPTSRAAILTILAMAFGKDKAVAMLIRFVGTLENAAPTIVETFGATEAMFLVAQASAMDEVRS